MGKTSHMAQPTNEAAPMYVNVPWLVYLMQAWTAEGVISFYCAGMHSKQED